MQSSSVDRPRAKPIPGLSLTPRERELFADLIARRTTLEIALARSISSNTVKFHVKNIFQKLGVTSRRQIHRFGDDRIRSVWHGESIL